MALNKLEKQLRKEFRNKYGRNTEEIIKRLKKGQETHKIADALNMPVRSVSSTKGNLTRGVYEPYDSVY